MLGDASDILASVACMAGYLMDVPPHWYEPRSVMIIQGDSDYVVTYEAGSYWPGAEETIAEWAELNGCPTATPNVTEYSGYNLHAIGCGDAPITLVQLLGVGHNPYWSECITPAQPPPYDHHAIVACACY